MSISVNAMRTIDRWAGIPLCALLTPIVWLEDLLRHALGKSKAPKRLLFIELSEMGSAILADPAMRYAQSQSLETYFLIFKSNAKSLSLLNTIPQERCLTINTNSLSTLIIDTFKVVIRMRALRIDAIVDLELFSRYTALLTGASGAFIRVGFDNFHGEGLWRGKMLTHRVQYNSQMHISRNFMALTRAVFAQGADVPKLKEVIDDAAMVLAKAAISQQSQSRVTQSISAAAARAGLKAESHWPMVLINANASDLLPQRRWPPAHFAELARRLEAALPDHLLVFTGAKDERDYIENIIRASGCQRAVNLAGGTEFEDLPALYSLSKLLITNDSGPGHFSAVTDIASIVLFGPETPVLYGSLGNSVSLSSGLACSPCVTANNHRKTACTNNRCMQMLGVDRVFEQALRSLGR